MNSPVIRRTIGELSRYLDSWRGAERPKSLVLQNIFSETDSIELFKNTFFKKANRNVLEITFKINFIRTKITGPGGKRVNTFELVP